MAFYSGAVYRADPAILKNKSGVFAQVVLEKQILKDTLAFGLIPSYLTAADVNDPSPAENDVLVLGTRVSLLKKLGFGYFEKTGLVLEYAPVVSGYHFRYHSWAAGMALETFGHYFSLLFTNSMSSLPSGYLTGSESDNYYFGFNITRRF